MGGVTRRLACVLAALGLAACAAPDDPGPPAVAATTTTAAPDGVRGPTVAWEAGRLDADGRRVVIGWTGGDPAAGPSDPCWVGYAPEVAAGPDRVVVSLRSYRSRVPLGPQQFCPDLGFVRTMAVPLHNPLAGRAVVDGHDGRRHRLAPVPLEPGWLPGGWQLVQELGQAGPGGDAWERSYGPGPDGGAAVADAAGVALVTVTDGPAAVAGAGQAGDRVVARPAVRGGTAAVVHVPADQRMVVRWREGRRDLVVAAAFPTRPSEQTVAAVRDLLVRVAQGLR